MTGILIGDILLAVSGHFDVSMHDLRGAIRTQHVCRCRAVAYHLCVELTNASNAEIGEAYGRDHSSVARGLERPLSFEFSAAIDHLRVQLTGQNAHAPLIVRRWPFRSRRKPIIPQFIRRHTA